MDVWPVPRKELTRRAALSLLGRGALALPLLNVALLDSSCSSSKNAGQAQPPLTDDQFLDQMEQAAFLFFWERAGTNTGQVLDRALASGAADSRTISSIAATGFGLTGLCIAAQRGYMPASQIQSRVLTTLNFIWTQLPQQNGFFYHFVDMNTGQRARQCEVSSIDTAILLCGVLACRQFFQESQIQTLATQIYERVNFPWMLNGGTTFSMGWTPENGFLNARYDTYCELMMLYLLAIGSPTFPVPASSWSAFSRPTVSFQNYTYISGGDPLFTHQYSHAWFDFRNKQDAYANYFNNSVAATKAHKAFCLSLASQFPDYSNNLWGITASDSINGYVAWGGPASMGPIDGSVVPCAPGGSIPFLAADCITALRNMQARYPSAWQRYSFVDAFNPLKNWYDADALGIDVGIAMLMAENYRSQFVWSTFMKNPEAQAAMTAAGFK
ncbi:MAG TPA: glucoamylase family protein [Terriglobales bacterium]|nr:glucoamylase family protein [Terriglobales bacterium]